MTSHSVFSLNHGDQKPQMNSSGFYKKKNPKECAACNAIENIQILVGKNRKPLNMISLGKSP